MTPTEAIELARSVLQGKPTEGCPIPFSYVQAGIELSKFTLEHIDYLRRIAHLEEQRDSLQKRCSELVLERRRLLGQTHCEYGSEP